MAVKLVSNLFRNHFLDPDDPVPFSLCLRDSSLHFLCDLRRIRRSGAKDDLKPWLHVLNRVDQMNNAFLPSDSTDEQDKRLIRINPVFCQFLARLTWIVFFRINAIVDDPSSFWVNVKEP